MNEIYNFPVSLQNVFTQSGTPIPKARAVVRDDTGVPLSIVSDKYHLVPHKEVIEQANKFIHQFGTPESSFHLDKEGAVLMGTYTYKEITKEIAVGETVGLRIYVENSYNASRSVVYRVGSLVMECLNGMVATRDMFDVRFRHMGKQELRLPEKDQVMEAFEAQTNQCSEFAKMTLSSTEYEDYSNKAVNDGVIPPKATQIGKPGKSVWDLSQMMTFYITHAGRANSSYIGRVRRLEKVSRWLEGTFNGSSSTQH